MGHLSDFEAYMYVWWMPLRKKWQQTSTLHTLQNSFYSKQEIQETPCGMQQPDLLENGWAIYASSHHIFPNIPLERRVPLSNGSNSGTPGLRLPNHLVISLRQQTSRFKQPRELTIGTELPCPNPSPTYYILSLNMALDCYLSQVYSFVGSQNPSNRASTPALS